MALLHIFLYGVLLCMGKGAECTLWCNKSHFTKRCIKKSAFAVVLFIVLSVMSCKEQNYINHITGADKKRPKIHGHVEFHFRGGRHLEASHMPNSTDHAKFNSSQEEKEPKMPAPPAEHEDYKGRTVFGLQGHHQGHQGRSRFAPEYQDMISGHHDGRNSFGPH